MSGQTCCSMRRKILVGIIRVLSEEECGIPDAELADVMRFDLATPDGKPVLAFRFCPWCGTARDPAGETRIVDVRLGPFQDPDPGEDDDEEGPGFEPPGGFDPEGGSDPLAG